MIFQTVITIYRLHVSYLLCLNKIGHYKNVLLDS